MLTDTLAGAFKSTIVRISSLWQADVHSGSAPTIVIAPDLRGARVATTGTLPPPTPPPPDVERVVRLRDGAIVRLRPIRPDDESRLQALFERLSARTVYERFFAWHRRLPAAWYRDFANVDYERRFALVAEETGADGVRVRGVARWEPAEEAGALEIALVIEDAWQGRGLGAALFEHLLEAAITRGYDRFCADVLAENARMLRLLRTRTQIQITSASHGVVHLCFTPGAAAPSERAVAAPGRPVAA
jgi:GNAT superfamily N-acetyltransferase